MKKVFYEKNKVINSENAIGANNRNYISFGVGTDLWLYNKLNSQGGGTTKCCYDILTNISFYLNGGKNSFKLANCEIYQIEF